MAAFSGAGRSQGALFHARSASDLSCNPAARSPSLHASTPPSPQHLALRLHSLSVDEQTLDREPPHRVVDTHLASSHPPQPPHGGFHDIAPCGIKGLANIGNQCYANCILQNLAHHPSLRDAFLASVRSGAPSVSLPALPIPQFQLIDCFQQWMRDMWSQTASHAQQLAPLVHPQQLLMAIAKRFPRFSGQDQQDAAELLRHLLDGLHADLARASPTSNHHLAGSKPNQVAASIIHEHFLGSFASIIECQRCNGRSEARETFLDFSLALPRNVLSQFDAPTPAARSPTAASASSSLRFTALPCALPPALDVSAAQIGSALSVLDCFKEFTHPEAIEGYRCQRCASEGKGSHQHASKRFLISKPPRTLCLHLKRFCHTLDGTLKKVDQWLAFPETLTLDPFCTLSALAERQSPPSIAGKSPAPKISYMLTGIVEHMGGIRGGHYVAYTRAALPPTFLGGSHAPQHATHGSDWFHLDDSRTRRCDLGEVLSRPAYMLFYQAT
jgi:ubiquitin C-terminal hydrolase